MESGDLTRAWPPPPRSLDSRVPESIQNPIDEAEKSFKVGANQAATVMCRVALEAMCNNLGIKPNPLVTAFKRLKDAGHIDSTIFEWGESIRKHGNLAAHDSGSRINRQDASDILDFVTAISNYVFGLRAQFDEFKARTEKSKP